MGTGILNLLANQIISHHTGLHDYVDVESINGDERIIVSYSSKQAAKDARNREKGIQRLRKAYSSGKVSKKTYHSVATINF